MDEKKTISGNVHKLLEIMKTLRDPKNGCPWDNEQTFETLIQHTIEEAYEVADAIDCNDTMALKDELGDLLFQIVFYAQIANESGFFNFQDIVETVSVKMVRRHPHVFGDVIYNSSEERLNAWEEIKRLEKNSQKETSEELNSESALDGVITTLPALSRANKLQKRAAREGFDWDSVAPILEKIREELEEVEVEINSGNRERQIDEVGDLLFCCVNLARKLDIDPETALRGGNAKFEKRFRIMEKLIKADNKGFNDMPIYDVLDIYWRQAKSQNSSNNDC
jgi:ATP diphosphatase